MENGLKDNSIDKKISLNNSPNDKENSERVMIQIQRPDQNLDMPTIEKLLEGTGIKLDPDYGPFSVNPKQGVFVVRGYASPESQKKAKQIPNITLFRDTTISPA